MLTLGLAIAAAALVQRPLIFPYDDNPGFDCPYHSIAAADLLVAEAVERERRPSRGDEPAALARVSAIMQACTDEYAWTPYRATVALNGAIGDVMYERALAMLRARGLDAHFVDEVKAELGESGIAALMSSDSDGNLDLVGEAVTRRLAARGRSIPSGAEEWTGLRREIGRGLAGLVLWTRSIDASSLQ